MSRVKRWLDRLDSLFEYLVLTCLVLMVLVVIWQIFSREVFNSTPIWSEETSRILMVWIGFLGIAIGFRERAHISIEFLVNKFPEAAQVWLERFVQAVVFVFGLYLLIQGWQFTVQTSGATLPATGLPRSILYVVMPVAGFMVCVYTALQVFGVRTEKHVGLTEEEHFE